MFALNIWGRSQPSQPRMKCEIMLNMALIRGENPMFENSEHDPNLDVMEWITWLSLDFTPVESVHLACVLLIGSS